MSILDAEAFDNKVEKAIGPRAKAETIASRTTRHITEHMDEDPVFYKKLSELIKAPKACIEYVITHELCHLIHRHHTQKYLELQTSEMPDWEKWKMKLANLLA